jgi:outer membrane protein assembly factor BamE
MKSTTIIISLLFILFSTGCIYKTPVQQGNILVQDDIDKIKPGMNKRQIAILLGTPAIADPFNHSRWDYVNSFKIKGKIDKVKKLSLYFEADKLIKTEGNYFPEKTKTTEIIEG